MCQTQVLVWGKISFNTDIPKRKSKLHTERSKLVASELVLLSWSFEISLKVRIIVKSSASTAFLELSWAVHRVLQLLFNVFTKSESPFFMNMACRLGLAIGGFAKRAHPARARYLNVNLARRNRDLQPGGKEIEGGGRGGEEEEKSDSW